MKTVLSLHRKWAHAVKTIRILQGLVSVILLPRLRFDQICAQGKWLGQAHGPEWFCNGPELGFFVCLFFFELGFISNYFF